VTLERDLLPFLADVGARDASTAGANQLYLRTLASVSNYGSSRTRWDGDATVIRSMVGVASTDPVTTSSATGSPIPDSDRAAYIISSEFGWRFSATVGHYRPHTGIDFAPGASYRGHPLVTPFAGTVVETGWESGYGRVVGIKTTATFKGQGIFLFYAHLEFIAPGIVPGVNVVAGQVIAGIGSSGGAYPVHLHFETRVGSNSKVDTWNPLLVMPQLRELFKIVGSTTKPYPNYTAIVLENGNGTPHRSTDDHY
jgi:murein DD-endopeptidase MepM/ murein hydrolase activator NlpD